MARLLITGGFGYIASHTLVALYEAGFDDVVVVVDDLRRSDPQMVRGSPSRPGGTPMHEAVDVTDIAALSRVFGEDRPRLRDRTGYVSGPEPCPQHCCHCRFTVL